MRATLMRKQRLDHIVYDQHKPKDLSQSTIKANEYCLLRNFVKAYSGDSYPKLLAFGDSVFLRTATDDTHKSSLCEMLSDRFREDIFLISGSGFHSSIFELFISVLEALPQRPRLAVVPINLRIFSPTWDLNPLYQFQSEVELLSSFDFKQADYILRDTKLSADIENPVVSTGLDAEEIISLNEFLDIIRGNPTVSSEAWKKRLKTIFQCHYMHRLHTEHRKIKSLKQTIKRLNGIDVSVYCYITPINYEAGNEYCGSVFTEAVEQNIYIIQKELGALSPEGSTSKNDSGLRFENLAFRCAKNLFFTPHNATEHLRFEGRSLIANQIAKADRALFNFRVY